MSNQENVNVDYQSRSLRNTRGRTENVTTSNITPLADDQFFRKGDKKEFVSFESINEKENNQET